MAKKSKKTTKPPKAERRASAPDTPSPGDTEPHRLEPLPPIRAARGRPRKPKTQVETGFLWDDLSWVQLEGARMAVMGMRPEDIAAKLGVTRNTVSNWKKNVTFRKTVQLMQRAANEQTLEDARVARTQLLNLGTRFAVAIANSEIGQVGPDGHWERELPEGTEVVRDIGKSATALNAIHSWYKTLSSQTGLQDRVIAGDRYSSSELEDLEEVLAELGVDGVEDTAVH